MARFAAIRPLSKYVGKQQEGIRQARFHQGPFFWRANSRTKTVTLNAITPAATIRMRVEAAANMISDPNTSIMDATTVATTVSLFSENSLRRISTAETSVPAPGLPLASENSHTKELAKLKVGVRRPIKTSPGNGATAGISWRQQSSDNEA